VLTPSTLTANGNAALASYSEVGYLYIGIGAYRDDAFTAIDSGVGDCITSTNNNAYLADTLIDGKYGCSIGNQAIASLGRFVPDHFSTVVVPGSAMPCPFALVCPSALFVYSGQPFAFTITALSANGTPTRNYTGLLASDVTVSAWDGAGSTTTANPAGGVLGTVAVSAASFVNGVAIAKSAYTFPTRYPVTAPATLAAPTDIYLRAIETSGAGTGAGAGVSSLRPAPLASLEGGIKIVSGRIKLDNTYGSELLTVPVVTRVQYWDGFRFVASTTDAKTSFSAADIVRSNCKLRDKGKPLVADPACTIAPPDNTAPPPVYMMLNGMTQFRQAVPGAGYSGSADLSINAITSPWLPSTKARIGVGVYKGGPVIYRREMY
jgi:MSHA biogenesis protein MshQ